MLEAIPAAPAASGSADAVAPEGRPLMSAVTGAAMSAAVAVKRKAVERIQDVMITLRLLWRD
jgi:hypothetical protein